MCSIYKAVPISRSQIRRLVKYFRILTNTEKVIYFDIMKFLEFDLPNMIKSFELEIVDSEEMADLCGETIPAERKIRLNEDIYLKAFDGDGYARFCVAHEIAHLLLHDMKSISLCRLQEGKKLITYKDPEWQADAFAGELLMYHPLIKNMSVLDIEIKCGVTGSAAATQHSKI